LLLCVQLCRGTGELRLVDGGSRCAGRVEVKHEGQWGTVCSYDFIWDVRGASVVCRQLGCGTVARTSPYTPFGAGAGRIWLQPFCRGTETALHYCPHYGWGQHYCGHDWDVGVTCSDAVELRLVNGGGPCAGRVEVKLRGQWGTVADNEWDMEDAEVVCQQLGCGSAKSAHAWTRFGKGSGPIHLAVVDCRGDESALWECTIKGWELYNGSHGWDVGVVCQGFVQLVGGDSACSGRVEVRQGRGWATLCKAHVDLNAAHVICKELGCGAALAVTGAAHFGAGAGPIWDGGFECAGNESLLSACARRLPHGQGCTHTSDAAIICSPYTGFRLVNGSTECTGRVELEARGTWGSLCDAGWDMPDAQVLCHHLGCGFAASVPRGGYFGTGSGPLWQDTFHCSGTESHLGECPAMALGTPACSPRHAAAVNCSGGAEPLRLVDGESRCDGRLEVALGGAWGRVLAQQWDASSASVVCRQLRCGTVQKAYTAPVLGPGSSPLVLGGLRCAGTEAHLAQCNATLHSTVPPGHVKEAAVVCSGSRRVRLASGPGRCAGRVEIYVQGTWSHVCEDAWDLRDAAVVCRQLGCGEALAAPGSAHYGRGLGPVWLGAGGCSGAEAMLWDCPAPAPAPALGQRGCKQGASVAAICSGQCSLRLAGGSSCTGRLEVFYNGTWGSVCANGTSPATAAVVCRQLGCGATGRLASAPATTQGSGPAWLAWVQCELGTDSLWHCPSAPWQLQPCDFPGDTHITCDGDPGSTRATPTPAMATGCPDGAACTGAHRSPTAGAGAMAVPTILCIILGTLLCLALGALAMQAWRTMAQHRGPGRAGDTISEAVYEELDYTLTPDYQEVHSGSDTPALSKHDPPDGYDDAVAMQHPREAAALGLRDGDFSEAAALAVGSRPSLSHPEPPGATTDAPASVPKDVGYDDVGVSGPRTSLHHMLANGVQDELLHHLGRDRAYTGFRLVNGSTECTGQVELEAHGTWGSLCDAGWDMPDTQVLCHHLGCGFATSVSHGGCFGTRSGPLWRDTFHCCGTESHLGECPAMALGTPACSLGHVAAVNCSGGAEPLRLVDGESRCDGRLEVALGGAWGQGLAQCNATLHSSVPPGRTKETAVVCSGRRQVRLVSGPRFCPSRVEVYVQGAWSCICKDTWDLWDAAVVCHQLGCECNQKCRAHMMREFLQAILILMHY
ncbi:scavenger receptor cysteine-rich domain-containing protein SCART1-like, partial [Dromaius novaehollandiae]|uniref:scavenger receptor cysteine-rich domain-containing protein SCART1-like n=1 Tax=Dromaius novaehollandiae TaxID=8790 RepID=UPI00311EA012